LLKLNERQFEAATHICGAAIVLSGPGSGKTSVITARALNLVDVHNVLPERLLTVTFSRAAAIEMRQRYIKCVAENDLTVGRVPEYGTLHGFCLKALKQFGFWRDGITSLILTVHPDVRRSGVLANPEFIGQMESRPVAQQAAVQYFGKERPVLGRCGIDAGKVDFFRQFNVVGLLISCVFPGSIAAAFDPLHRVPCPSMQIWPEQPAS